MIQVTMNQWNVLTYIKAHFQQHGHAPSNLDIATACGLSSRHAARRVVKKLETMGLVRFGKFKAVRTVALCKVKVTVAP